MKDFAVKNATIEKKSSIERNLTEGNVAKQLILFALPFMLSNFIQTLYNVADMLIVGNYVGSAGVSGVNIGGQVTFIMTNIVIGLSAGGTVVIAQYLGSGERKSMNESIRTLITSLLVAAVVFTVVMTLLSDHILRLLQTPEESYRQARDYLNITLSGTIFIFGYNAFSAILRGLGDSRSPLIFVTIACIVNVFLDILMVGGLGMEAAGAALATIISQAISMISCIVYLKKKGFEFDFKLSSFRFYKERFVMLMNVGIPISVQNVIVNFSFLVLTAIANSMGVSASAALGIVGKYNGFAILPAIAVGSSVSAMVAQNIGAGMVDRAKRTFHVGFTLAFIITLVVFIITRLFPEQILSMFGDDPDMIAAGVEYLKSFSIDYIIVPAAFCLNGVISGSGHTIVSSICGILAAIGFRIPFAILLGKVMNLGMWGLGFAAPIASLGATIITFIYYISGKWEKSNVVKNSPIDNES
ncbi:MAG TPA: MATE family efflux transporter [Clostridiaceae bacterium]|nr:MATE family efflux transporter [Clostridiaceae bacterium]